MIKSVLENSKAVYVCPQCGKEFVGDFLREFTELYANSICPLCMKVNAEVKKQQNAQKRKNNLLSTLDERMEKAGFEGVFCNIDTPIIRHNAEFIWKEKDNNLLISGETGAGKTSSAAFVARVMMKEKKYNFCYSTWSALHSEYVAAKTDNNDKSAEKRFFAKLNNLDYLIIDELAWRRGGAKLTPAAQELLFDIIDKAYNKGRKCRVWLMGNLYNNAFETLLDQPEPIMRRLNFAFTQVWFDEKNPPQKITVAKSGAR